MEEFNKSLEEVISYIQNSNEYQTCISLKEQMNDNEEIKELVNQIKILQKKYIRSDYDSTLKEELNQLEEKLNNIPVYHIYSSHLERVNEMIDTVKESLNQYFQELLNKKN